MLGSRIVTRSLTAGSLIALLVTALMPATAAAAAGLIRFNVYMGDQCVEGVAPAQTNIELLWERADTWVKLSATTEVNPDGTFSLCSIPGMVVEAGDVIKIWQGANEHELIVPQLTLFQNRVNDIYKGRGPAGQMVKLICGPTSSFEPCVRSWRIRVSSQGKWSLNPHWDVRGRNHMGLVWKSAAGDSVRVSNTAPHLDLTIGKAFVAGSGRAGSPVTVVLKDASTFDVRGTALAMSSRLDGRFGGRFQNQRGGSVPARVGDIVTSMIAPDADFVIPNIPGDADAAANQVTGRCPEKSTFDWRAFRNGIEYDGYRWFTDDDGSFAAGFAGLRVGDRVLVGCELSTGDWVRKAFVAH